MPSPLRLRVLLAFLIASPSWVCSQAPDPEDLDFRDGVAAIPDRATFRRLSHQGNAGRDAYLNGIQFVKFILTGAGGKDAKLYFMNTKTRQAHPMFMRDLGVGGGFGGFGRRGRRGRGRGERGRGERREEEGVRTMRGAIAFRPLVSSPDGSPGVYTFDFQPNDAFSVRLLTICRDAILAKAPFLKGKFVYHPLRGGLARYEREKAEFEKVGLPVYLDEVLDRNIAYLPMNPGQTFGRLRRIKAGERPSARDVVLYEELPNELPRVAGMITGARQTPLSHVNLRAIQDRVPNAYLTNAAQHPRVAKLIGKYVRYVVRKDGFEIREATRKEVEAHFGSVRPKGIQTPALDLSVKEIRPLDAIAFGSGAAFGVKTSNVAALRKLSLRGVEVPDGFGVPFHFYDAFMRHNGLREKVGRMLADSELRSDEQRQRKALSALRKDIRRGEVPAAMKDALAKVQKSFGEGAFIRCRSSTNNEDLPGFSGAGLYGSYTHDPDEGHLSETVKQVFASLWSDRAFDDREFYRIDHTKTAMGVLIHPSFKKERANGVAVTLDVLYRRDGYNYVNVQVGEDMVTNPESRSVPEELLIPWRRGSARVMQASNRIKVGQRVLGQAHEAALKSALEKIHDGFAKHYGKDYSDPKFAMEIEFKVTHAGKLAIKQARPWIFATDPPHDPGQ